MKWFILLAVTLSVSVSESGVVFNETFLNITTFRPQPPTVMPPSNEITINLIVHYDTKLSYQLMKQHRWKNRKPLLNYTRNLISELEALFRDPILSVKVHFELESTKSLTKKIPINVTGDASKYLKSYCNWQATKKKNNKQMYSMLMSGLDLYSRRRRDKVVVRETVAHSYRNSICNTKRSCALFQWRPDIMKYLLAHEIGHSLGMVHDDPSINKCRSDGIMAKRYNRDGPAVKWTYCDRTAIKVFLASHKSKCLKKSSR